MNSCLYRGWVTHRRQTPVEHRFRYQLFWLYLDLDEWPVVSRQVRGLCDRRVAPAAFYRPDHLGDADLPLADAVRQFVAEQSGKQLATGAIRLLTQPRSLGFYFSPLNLYYCYGSDDSLAAVVAEVNNTPWGEQHCYLLWDGNRVAGEEHRYRHRKTFHVSPFMAMDQSYAWQLNAPGDSLSVQLATERDDQPYFDAAMQLTREPLTTGGLARRLATSPVNAGRVLAAIYFEAFRLWMKRCPYYPHPKSDQQHAAPA